MSLYRIQHTLAGASGSSEDRYVQTFAITTAAPLVTSEFEDVFDAFETFYTADQSTLAAVYGFFSPAVSQFGHQIKAYNLGTPPPHLPIATREYDLPTAPINDEPWPSEVAVCLSLRGDLVAGTDVGPGPHLRARHRNRTYFGPLRGIAGTFAANEVRPSDLLVDTLLEAVGDLNADLIALTPSCRLAIWSPTRNDGEAAELAWVDDAFDTQRRRGAEPTSRTTLVLP